MPKVPLGIIYEIIYYDGQAYILVIHVQTSFRIYSKRRPKVLYYTSVYCVLYPRVSPQVDIAQQNVGFENNFIK